MAGGPGVAKPATLVGTTPSGVEHQLDATSPNTRFAREGRKLGTIPSGVEHQLDTTFPNTRFAREGRKQVESY